MRGSYARHILIHSIPSIEPVSFPSTVLAVIWMPLNRSSLLWWATSIRTYISRRKNLQTELLQIFIQFIWFQLSQAIYIYINIFIIIIIFYIVVNNIQIRFISIKFHRIKLNGFSICLLNSVAMNVIHYRVYQVSRICIRYKYVRCVQGYGLGQTQWRCTAVLATNISFSG